MDYSDVSGWLTASNSALQLMKSAFAMLPASVDRDAIEAKLKEAEDALRRSDAKLAKELGYRLCECTFPPQIMLWREADQAQVCPNAACGRRISWQRPEVNRGGSRLTAARRGEPDPRP